MSSYVTALAASLATATLVLAAPAYADTVQVSIMGHMFMPATLTIAPGTTVTWTNHDADPHTVTDGANPKAFHSSALDTGDTFSYTFTTAGTFQYFCTLHPMMVGHVTVTAPK